MKCLLGLLLLFPLLVCRAQPEHYQFRHLNINQGLSHNQVNCFFKDKKGFLWIGTISGLNRFDGYNVKTYFNDPDNTSSVGDNFINRIFELPDLRLGIVTSVGFSIYDPETEAFSTEVDFLDETYKVRGADLSNVVSDSIGQYWFIHRSSGIVVYNPREKESVQLRHVAGNAFSISSDSVADYACGKGDHWIIHANGTLEKITFDKETPRVSYRNTFLKDLNKGRILNYSIVVDHDGDLWIYVRNFPQGIYYFNAATRKLQHYDHRTSPVRLSSDIVSSVVVEDNGMIWIATDHGGVNVIDKRDFSVHYILNRPEEERSIGQNTISTIYRDDEGILWLGTFKKGVSYYHKNLIRFPLYKHYPLSKSGLPYGDVNRFVEDKSGNLWIGTNGGGLIYFDRKKNTFKQYLHDPNDNNSISSNVIVSLCIDHQQNVWIGTYYGGLNRFDGKRFYHYTHDPLDPGSLSDQNVWEIFEDTRRRLWVGTMHGGLNLYDDNTNTFSHYRQSDVNSVKSDYIPVITEDKSGNIWIGTAQGVDMLERQSGRFFHYGHTKEKGSLGDDFIFDIKEDSRGRIWIATRNGLNIFDRDSKTFSELKAKDGLPSNTILTILEDNAGTIWLSTANGLCNVIATETKSGLTFKFRNYDEADGLQGKQFNENAAFKTRSGELIFGGANGFNIFKPEQLSLNNTPPAVLISDFQLYNESVQPGEEINGEVLLQTSITSTREIVLQPDQNVFAIEFVALNFFNPEKNQYQYKLSGSHAEWLKADAKSRKVSFTNLAPGTYTFTVKASNNDGFWNNKGASVKIRVLPPFWKTRTAFVFYCLFVIGGLLVTRKLIQKRERLKFERVQERQEAIRMHELDMMKIKFFTNVSHEFRTPLTLILTPLEKMIQQTKDAVQQQQFQLIQRNAKRLLNLVNQLLDFRKLEVQELKLNPSEGDIIRFLHDTVYSFSDLSEKKDIKLTFSSTVPTLETMFDQDKLEKIIFNLLSNAFKFTPEHGAVTVTADLENAMGGKVLKLKFQDTGIGIPADKLERIFDRFFQNELPKTLLNQGSGIGLSITKEFVKIHGGTISVESEVGKGSTFLVELPVTEVASHTVPSSETVDDYMPAPVLEENTYSKKPVLLIVEDNEDFRFYLKDNLKGEYKVIEARNGNEGWKMALENLPDLIVSDVMMPELNGIELCKKIKSDSRTSHTPVILLTARSGEEQKMEGFESGADDYVTKPFNFEILVSRIKNLITLRQKFHKGFPAQLDVKASELKITSLDEKFIQKAIKCVEDHVSDPDFSVEELSRELGISRAHFYKKVMALTGKSPLEFIRVIRLQQAAQLLKKSQLTVAEVAYKVGFNNPKYFARYFKEEYKVLPSAYAAASKKEGS
jgi:signal transduction histidine kinase/ligand-binding sensor domain-containing protein/DNA-binding response OmpR family regulator